MDDRHYQNSISHTEYKLTARLNIFMYIISLTPHKIPKEAGVIYLHLQVKCRNKCGVSESENPASARQLTGSMIFQASYLMDPNLYL